MFTVEINLTLSDCSVITFLCCYFLIYYEYILHKGTVLGLLCHYFMFWNAKGHSNILTLF